MLVAIAVLGVSAHTFELQALIAQPHESTWLFLAFAAAFCIKAPLFPLHGWLPAAYRESTPEVTALLSGVISKAGAYGLLRFAVPLFPSVAHDWRWLFLGLGLAGLLYGARDRVPPAGRARRGRLLEHEPDEPDRDRDLRRSTRTGSPARSCRW